MRILLTHDEPFAFDCVNKFRNGVLVLLHLVGKLLLGHFALIPQQVDQHELFRGQRHVHLTEFACNELFESAACEIQFDCDFFR